MCLIVLFKFAPHATEADRQRFQEENEGLGVTLRSIGVESVQCKPILPGPPSFITKGFDVASVTVLRDLDALNAFREASAHREIVDKHKPLLEGWGLTSRNEEFLLNALTPSCYHSKTDLCATQIEY